ncbi:protein of unknown function [Candidatus Nitrospira inopinata]|uniref:Uncharacterized protein n=1 Tax=Candidatus Nitrospira inopinata TaxID=1715989 RepID=A0A0S4KRQ2_9BACT|nr:protein of unknown function [Candidatus Nitrospira inopinata]
MGFRPEEKGIKTKIARYIMPPLRGWDSDLKKKGLRQSGPHARPMEPAWGWDSDLKKKGLRRLGG